MNSDAGGKSALSEGLGPLPEPDVPLVRGGCYTDSLVRKIVAEKVSAERERCARAAREAIHSVPAAQRISADILIHATDTAIGWPNAGSNAGAVGDSR